MSSASITAVTVTFHGDFFVADYTLADSAKAKVVLSFEEGAEEPSFLVDAPEASMSTALEMATRQIVGAIIDADGE
ncbi:hypothetical protein UFOVP708_47 [uncultured Caudovirales phage]|uniref:Uncharacterized protein n=1 Tax=uncultured Caudovirales phage TaxID=2100421 RepID=A0A6J5NNV4_9CAUD|nr:hypothetical protein UFOVP708_47 [uncultured Caudovirales phage]